MYETLEHWKQYKQKKKFNTNFMLVNKISKEFGLDKAIKDANKEKSLKEFDKWLNKLGEKNGTTNY